MNASKIAAGASRAAACLRSASRATTIVTFLLAALTGCQSAFPPAADQSARAEPPRLALGDTWIYRHTDGYTKFTRGTWTQKITAINGDVVTVQIAADGKVVRTDQFTRDWNWLDKPMTNIQRFRYQPPYAAFRFPLMPSESWSEYMQATDVATGQTYKLARVDGRVRSWQRVTVPAGAFDAIEVYRNAYSGVETFWRTQEYTREEEWYSPAVNNVVYASYRSTYKDKTQNGEVDTGWRANDWTIVELLEYRPAQR